MSEPPFLFMVVVGISEVLKYLVHNRCSASGPCGSYYYSMLSSAQNLLLLLDCIVSDDGQPDSVITRCSRDTLAASLCGPGKQYVSLHP